MKIALLIVFLISSSAFSEPVVTDYPVRGIPTESAKFEALLDAVNKTTRQLVSLRSVVLSPEARRALAMAPKDSISEDVGTIPPCIKILQTAGKNRYLATRSDSVISIIVPEETSEYNDGKIVCGILSETEKNYQYTDTLGALRTVKEFKFEPYTDDVMTAQRLIERLKSGEVLTIRKDSVETKCSKCDGWGRIASTKGAGSPKEECSSCKGIGKRMVPLFLRIKW